MIEKHYNISEVADMLGVHQNTLRNWEKRGKIKPVRLPGGYRRYAASEINRVLSPDNGETFSRAKKHNRGGG